MNDFAVRSAVAARVCCLMAISALVSTEAFAVSIVFSESSFTIDDDTALGGSGSSTIMLELTDLHDPDPDVARFELLVNGQVQNRRFNFSEQIIEQGVLRGESFVSNFSATLFIDYPGVSLTLAEFSGLDGALGSFEEFHADFFDAIPTPGEPNEVFDSPMFWSARLVVAVPAPPGETVGGFSFSNASAGQHCESLNGVLLDCVGDGGNSEGAFRTVSFTRVPEPASGLLIASACFAAMTTGRGARRDRLRRS